MPVRIPGNAAGRTCAYTVCQRVAPKAKAACLMVLGTARKASLVAIIIIGNEILSGRTQDVNVSFLAKWLNDLGVSVGEVRIIEDKEESIINCIKEIKKNFREGYNLNDEILEFLATEISSSVREMVGSLNRVIAFSKISNKPPSIYDCKRILKDFIDYNKKSINVEFIQNIVASYFNLNIEEMLSPRRSRSLARPRQIAMYLAKNLTTNSLPEIGRKFSNRDHTTVIHAVKKINELIKKDTEINKYITEIKKKLL